jgi:NAD-dependent dihydropyrimidine dehydrogenase PreA subunit
MATKLVRKIVNIDEAKCNGCGLCVPACAEGALQIIDGKARLVSDKYCDGLGACLGECPRGAITIEEREADVFDEVAAGAGWQPSRLGHWPVQLTLVPPRAPFLQGADVVLAADCVPFAYAGFHQEFLEGHALLVACPKLDDFAAHQRKLAEILSSSEIKSLTVVHMEVPCCSGLVHLARQAIAASGQDIPLREVTIGIRGTIKNRIEAVK